MCPAQEKERLMSNLKKFVVIVSLFVVSACETRLKVDGWKHGSGPEVLELLNGPEVSEPLKLASQCE